MKHVLTVLLLVGFVLCQAGAAAGLVEWESEESSVRLSRSAHKADFFRLTNHFISQDNKIFCGPVSSAIVLNALRLGKKKGLPQDAYSIAEDERAWLPKGFNPFFGKYTPNNVLTDQTKIEVLGKPIEIQGTMKKDFGLQLRQLAQALLTIAQYGDALPFSLPPSKDRPACSGVTILCGSQ